MGFLQGRLLYRFARVTFAPVVQRLVVYLSVHRDVSEAEVSVRTSLKI